MRPVLLLAALAACSSDTPKDDTDTDLVVETDVETDVVDTDVVDTDTDVGPVEPQPMDVTLTPDAPLEGMSLSCTADTTSAVAWAWTVDGVPAGVTGATVPEGRTSAHEVWACQGETTDGLYVGEASVEVGELCRSLAVPEAAPDSLAFPAMVADANGRVALRAVDDAFTVEFWYLATRTGVDEDLVSHVEPVLGAGPKIDFVVRLSATGLLEFVTSGKAEADCPILTATAPAPGTWHHIAASWDPTTEIKRLYVDGVFQDYCRTADRPTGGVRGALTIGATITGKLREPIENAFVGWIDEVRFSSKERYQLSTITPPTFSKPDADTLILLHFDRTFETTSGSDTVLWAPDASANGWDAQLTPPVTVSPDHSACTPDDTVPVDTDTDVDTQIP